MGRKGWTIIIAVIMGAIIGAVIGYLVGQSVRHFDPYLIECFNRMKEQ